MLAPFTLPVHSDMKILTSAAVEKVHKLFDWNVHYFIFIFGFINNFSFFLRIDCNDWIYLNVLALVTCIEYSLWIFF
jgi:hypothetical protein